MPKCFDVHGAIGDDSAQTKLFSAHGLNCQMFGGHPTSCVHHAAAGRLDSPLGGGFASVSSAVGCMLVVCTVVRQNWQCTALAVNSSGVNKRWIARIMELPLV